MWSLFGYKFSRCETLDEVLTCCYERAAKSKDRLPFLATINVDQVVQFEKDDEIRSWIRKAEIVVPDGAPIASCLRTFTGWRGQGRLTGSDFFPMFMSEALARGSKILFVVASESVRDKLCTLAPDQEILVAPDLRNLSTIEVKVAVNGLLKDSTREWDFVYVGLGLPARERFAFAMYDLGIDHPLYLLLGAALEFTIGLQTRAPRLYRDNGLEWFFRLMSDPSRMYKRYLVSSWYFIWIYIRELREYILR